MNFDDAYQAIQSGDNTKAFKIINQLAKQGDAQDQYLLGVECQYIVDTF